MLILTRLYQSKVGKVDTHFYFFLQKQSRQSRELIFLLLTNQSRQNRDVFLFTCYKQSKVGKVETYSYLFVAKQSRQIYAYFIWQSRHSFYFFFTKAK